MANITTGFKQTIGLMDGTLIVAGSMIGSGIFIVSADMARNVGSTGWLMAMWVITGVMTISAALSYGELSAMFPKAGGQYVYLKEAYNPLTGFLYGWSFFTVIQTGTIAAVGVAFSKFAGVFIPALEKTDANVIFQFNSSFKVHWAELVSIALVIFLTYINSRGVKEAKLIQRVFTSAKLLAIFGLIVFGFLLAGNANVWHANWATGLHLRTTDAINDASGKQIGWSLFHEPSGILVSIGIIASAMVGSVFSSDAWNNVTFIAGEMKNPKRNVGLSLFFGTLIVTVVYILVNLMYTAVLPLAPALQSGVRSYPLQTIGTLAFPLQDRVATAAADTIFGQVGTGIIAILIMISTFGCNNGLILAGARVYYAMAKDGMFLEKAGTLNKNSVPGWALWAQCAWTSLLCLSGTYGLLLDYVVFVALVFYILTIIGIFRLRKIQPNIERPYKAFGYPFLPILYILLASTMSIGLLFAKPETSIPGLAIVLLGIPVYYFNKKKEVLE